MLYEKSTSEFHQFPENYIHRFSQQSDTGISIDLLQEYVFIPLDIFYRILHNKGIRNQLKYRAGDGYVFKRIAGTG